MGVVEGRDPRDLAQAGWGIIFAAEHGEAQAIREALGPLLEHRQHQATRQEVRLYREFAGAEGYRPRESGNAFLARHGIAAGPVDPARGVPYYLLIVGGPEQIPFDFQAQLGVWYAVGRVGLPTLDAYAAYAESVVRAELAPRPAGPIAIFGVSHPDDRYTAQAHQGLIAPLMQSLAERYPQVPQTSVTGPAATRAALAELLHAGAPPGVLICAGHGVVFPAGHPLQRANQGALLCADWPGPAAWSGPLRREHYFAAEDLGPDADLTGMIALFTSAYSAGTPQTEGASRAPDGPRRELAPEPFLAALPAAMLGRPRGALAVVGRYEGGASFSLGTSPAPAESRALTDVVTKVLNGQPIGDALDGLGLVYAQRAARLVEELESVRFGKTADPVELAALWAARNVARSYTLLGDPAVRLGRGEGDASMAA